MSESTTEHAVSGSDMLEFLPPEVAEALGKTVNKPAPDPTAEENDTEETPETEAEEVPVESTEDESDDSSDEESADESSEGEEDRGTKKLEKRIDKLTRRRKEAEALAETLTAERDALKAEVDKRSAIRLEPTPEDPLADLDSMEELDAKVAAAKKVRSWAMANPDGATVTDSDGSERYVDRSEIAKFLSQTDALLTDHAPARKEYLKERESLLPEAKIAYPALFKSGTPEHKILVDTLKQVPLLKRLPAYELVIGDAIEGMKARLSKTAANSKNADAKKISAASKSKVIAPAIPRSGASRIAPTQSKSKSAALDAVMADGSLDALTSYFNAA